MRKTFFFLLFTTFLLTSTSLAQEFNVRNGWGLRMGAVATRPAYFLFDPVAIIRPGTTSSPVSRKALQLILDFKPEACVAFTTEELRQHKNRELLEIRAIAYHYLFAHEKAMADYQQALLLLPDGTTYQAIVHHYDALENDAEAVRWAQKGLKAFPASVTLWHAYARAMEKAPPDWKAALPLYARAAELDGSGRFYNMAAGLCWVYGDSPAGIPYLSEAITAEPDNAFYYDRRASFYRDAGHYEKAVTDHRQAIALAPDRSGYWHSLAETYHWLGDHPGKQEALKQAEALSYGECRCIIHD